MVECGSGALNRGKLPEQKITHRSCSSDAWTKVNVLRLLCHVGPCRGGMVIIPKRRNDDHDTHYLYFCFRTFAVFISTVPCSDSVFPILSSSKSRRTVLDCVI